MQANLSIINDVEAVRQLVDAGHGQVRHSSYGILVPSHLVDGFKWKKLVKAGFSVKVHSTWFIAVK